ncbi:MAG: four helix bundle protein [Lentisphaerales bacterium]|nr:four helix bundle protein [Lentisphaerales bacterium]
MAYANSFRELVVYQKPFEVSQKIYELNISFPNEEKFSLTDQIRRSSRSAWGKSKYPKHFTSKLTDADSDQLETQHWLDISLKCNYINMDTYSHLNHLLEEFVKMLYSMISKADSFGNKNEIREEEMEYFLTSNSNTKY